PDTGRLSVVAMMFSLPGLVLVPEGTWFWTSDDNGRTWSSPQPLELPTDPHFAPRLAAGPNGFLVLVNFGGLRTRMGALDPVSETGVYASISQDAGRTWATKQITPNERVGYPGYGPAVLHDAGETIEVVLAYQRNVSIVRSVDGGGTWAEPQPVGQLPTDYRWWAIGAGDGKGQTVVLAEYDSACAGTDEARRWGVDLFYEEADQMFARLPMAGPLATGVMDGCGGGNDYAGLAFAVDGSLWAAWADPRGGDGAAGIAVTRLVRAD
ncbi:MAG TPA: sialidase family protein, partial [Candidatus Thermoplasmatota archaeon]